MRRIALLTLALATLGLAIGGVSLASQGPANNAQPLVLDLISRATAINDFVDTGLTGFSPGDLYVFSDRLFRADAPQEQIGRVDGRCVLINAAELRFDCSFTNHLVGAGGMPAGDVMGAGTLSLVEGTTSTVAVVGGTGPYRTVRGEATIELGPFEGPHEITANLVLNT